MAQFFYGWVIVGCAFTVLFLTYGVQYAYGVFVPAIVADLGWPHVVLGAVFSLYGTLYTGLTMCAGYLTDRFGPRRVLAGGGMLLGIGLMLSSRVTAPWQLFLSYGLVAALGMSTAYIPCNMTVVRWFTQNRGRALGIAASGASSGILAVPLLAAALIAAIGWRSSLFWLGMGVLLLTNLAARFIVTPPPLAAPVRRADHADVNPSADTGFTFREARTAPAFWWLVVGFAVALVTMTVPFVHITQFAIDRGLGTTAGAACISMIGLFAIVGNLLLGQVADRVSVMLAFEIGLAAQIFAYLALLNADMTVTLYVAAAAFGLFYGAFASLFPALVASMFGSTHARGQSADSSWAAADCSAAGVQPRLVGCATATETTSRHSSAAWL